jgi:type IV secretory pathway component VirB8
MTEEELIHQNIIEEKRNIANAKREAMLAFWSALLAVNGIFIAAFSIVAITNIANRWLSILSLIISFICSGSLIQNFRDVIEQHRDMDNFGQRNIDSIVAGEWEEVKNTTIKRNRSILQRENIVVLLMFLQAILILVLLFFKLLDK